MSEEKQSTDKKINRDTLKWVVIGLAGFAVVILIFGAGMFVGGMKAKFSYRWAENYHRNFAGPREGFFSKLREFPTRDFISGHGSFGEVIEIKDKEFVIKSRENIEKVIVIKDDTIITKGRKRIKDGLAVGDNVVIIGSPNDEGKIEAKMIRIIPFLPGELPSPQSRRPGKMLFKL